MKVISKMICSMVKASTQLEMQVGSTKANFKIIYTMGTANLLTLMVEFSKVNSLKERWKAKVKLF